MQATFSVKDLKLDDLGSAGIRGHVTAACLSANLQDESGSVLFDIISPSFGKFDSEHLHVEAHARDGTARLLNTKLQQAGSSYEMEGEYQYGTFQSLLRQMATKRATGTPHAAVEVVDASRRTDPTSEASDSTHKRGAAIAMDQLSTEAGKGMRHAYNTPDKTEAASSEATAAQRPHAAGWDVGFGGAGNMPRKERDIPEADSAVDPTDIVGREKLCPQGVNDFEPRKGGRYLHDRADVGDAGPQQEGTAIAVRKADAHAGPEERVGVGEGEEKMLASSNLAAATPAAEEAAGPGAEIAVEGRDHLAQRSNSSGLGQSRDSGTGGSSAVAAGEGQELGVAGCGALAEASAPEGLTNSGVENSAAEATVADRNAVESAARRPWWRLRWLRVPRISVPWRRGTTNASSNLTTTAPVQTSLPSSGLLAVGFDGPDVDSAPVTPGTVEGEEGIVDEGDRMESSSQAKEGEGEKTTQMTWWLQVRADAQLQEIVPAVAAQGSTPQAQGNAANAALARGEEVEEDGAASVLQEGLRFSGQDLDMSYEGEGHDRSADYMEFERALRRGAWVAGQPQVAVTTSDSSLAGQPQRLPGLESLTGNVKGVLVASGGPKGASSVHIDMKGERWQWGPILMQSLDISGTLDEEAGLQLERLYAEVPPIRLTSISLEVLFLMLSLGYFLVSVCHQQQTPFSSSTSWRDH